MPYRGVFSLLFCLAALGQQPPAAPKPDAPKGLPLKPERKIEFTTSEGTWISLDVSPDGKTIVFELLGDIYTLPIEGGEAKRLLGGMAFESQPRYSPDGKWIAFLSDREGSENLWIAKPDGSEPKQLTKDARGEYASPSWTADSNYVIVSRADGARSIQELWMYHVQGGSGIQVTKSKPTPTTPRDQQLRAMGGVASADGRYLYYAQRKANFGYNVTMPAWQIVRRDRRTGDDDTITSEPGSAFSPRLSPDGKSLVYATRHETETGFRIRTLATGEERWLKFPVQRDDQEGRATRDVYPGYAFLPDGKSLVVFYGGKIHQVDIASGGDRVIPFQASVSLDLGPKLEFAERVEDGPAVKVHLIQHPAQSPDGKQLVFSALSHIYRMPLPAGSPTRLTAVNASEYQPSWSPDGKWISYVTWQAGEGQIWKMQADGSGVPQQLTRTPGFYREPVWSPDGTRIVARRGLVSERQRNESSGAMDVVWLPSAGGETQLVVPSRGLGQPHFTTENDRIYVYGAQGLQSFRFDGSDRRTLLKVVAKETGAAEPEPASDVVIHPNGQSAIALLANQVWLVTIPQTGGETPTVNLGSPSVPVKKLSDLGADYIGWAESGRAITWGAGSNFFRVPLESVRFEAGAKLKPEEIAVTLEVPRARPAGSMVLRGAKVITMRGDEVIPNADIVITENRIIAVGKRGSVAVPAGAKIQDMRGATVIPGIVDIHAHWTENKRGVLDTQSWPLLANLAYGVTTGRDPQTFNTDAFAYRDMVDSGMIAGQRAFSTGPGVFGDTDFQSVDDAKNVVARYRNLYRTNTLKSYVVGNRRQRQWMIEACKQYKIMPTTEGALDMKLNLTHAIDGFSGNEHALPIVPLYEDVVNLYARSGIFYTPTLLVAYGGPWAENFFYETTEVYGDPKLKRFIPQSVLYQKATRRPWFRKEEHVFPKLAAEAAKIVRAGGHVQIGGHGQLQGIQCHWEMWALASGGLTNLEVLRAATLHGAQAIGYAQDLGSIEPGKLADLVVLGKDPLADIHNTSSIRYVVKNGEMFEGDTLNQVWPQQKRLPEMWWVKEQP